MYVFAYVCIYGYISWMTCPTKWRTDGKICRIYTVQLTYLKWRDVVIYQRLLVPNDPKSCDARRILAPQLWSKPGFVWSPCTLPFTCSLHQKGRNPGGWGVVDCFAVGRVAFFNLAPDSLCMPLAILWQSYVQRSLAKTNHVFFPIIPVVSQYGNISSGIPLAHSSTPIISQSYLYWYYFNTSITVISRFIPSISHLYPVNIPLIIDVH